MDVLEFYGRNRNHAVLCCPGNFGDNGGFSEHASWLAMVVGAVFGFLPQALTSKRRSSAELWVAEPICLHLVLPLPVTHVQTDSLSWHSRRKDFAEAAFVNTFLWASLCSSLTSPGSSMRNPNLHRFIAHVKSTHSQVDVSGILTKMGCWFQKGHSASGVTAMWFIWIWHFSDRKDRWAFLEVTPSLIQQCWAQNAQPCPSARFSRHDFLGRHCQD